MPITLINILTVVTYLGIYVVCVAQHWCAKNLMCYTHIVIYSEEPTSKLGCPAMKQGPRWQNEQEGYQWIHLFNRRGHPFIDTAYKNYLVSL